MEFVGAGGMGEVYRARDTRLGRNVAIKVLPSEDSGDARMRIRLEREARTISALNHPHICSLHDVGRENDLDYLVLEFCEGQTLARRLDHGALPIDHVLQFGIEIAEALSRAHHAGIIHRDLKPSNIMLTKSGVKLLDFGLAKLRADSSPSESTDQLISEEGKILGTMPYTAPELLAGAIADARSDIFAMGAVLYEMLTGKPAFAGANKASVMAAILERDPPPVCKVRPAIPAALEHVIARCLTKSRDERWESAHDLAEELRWIRSAPAAQAARRNRWPMVVAAVAGLAALATALLIGMDRKREGERVVRLVIPVGEKLLAGPVGMTLAVSPDAKRVVYSAQMGGHQQLYVRQLDSFESVPLEGSEGAQSPFFSPDGQWIGFFSSGAIRKVPVAGGTPKMITGPVATPGRGAWWARDDTIYFGRTPSSGIWKAPASGGEPQLVTEPNRAAGENSHRWPQVLPDGKHLLFTIRTSDMESFDRAKIAVFSLESGKWRVVLEGGSCARYVSSGHLVFARGGALYAVLFDPRSLSVNGKPRKVLDGVITVPGSGLAEYSLNDRGDLIYLAGGILEGRTELVSFDRAGGSTVLGSVNVIATRLAVSPDGRRIAFTAFRANDDIWSFDRDSGVTSRLTFDPGDEYNAVWTPDGTRIIYSAAGRLLLKRADGAGETEELVRSIDPFVTSCSPDGHFAAYTDLGQETGYDILVVPLGKDRSSRALLRTQFDEWGAAYSPDGKWIAYTAYETVSGPPEVYVRPVDGRDMRWQISSGGADSLPKWSVNGKAVFYRYGEGLFAVSVALTGDNVRVGKPQRLFTAPEMDAGRFGTLSFDVDKDRFVFVRQLRPPAPRQVNVVLNWMQQLQR